MSNNKTSRGFTLVESMIATSIGLVVAGSAIWFLVQGVRISLRTSAASTNDLAEWGILTNVTIDTKIANGMIMYPDFNQTTVANRANRRATGQTGNVLILTQTTQSSVSATPAKLEQITGYVYDSTYKSFKKFSYQVKPAEQTAPDSLETILNNNYNSFTLQTIADNVTGALSGAAFLCRDAAGQSGILNIQVSSGNANVSTNSNKIIDTPFHIRG